MKKTVLALSATVALAIALTAGAGGQKVKIGFINAMSGSEAEIGET